MRYLLFLILLGTCTYLQAQQAAQASQYSLYVLNPFALNPAAAGLDNSISITGVYRNQWVNIPGSPVTQNLNAHMPLYLAGGGTGINLENESLGAQRTTTVTLAYDYWLRFGETSILSVGLAGGISQKTLDGTKIRTPEGSYDSQQGVFDHNDDSLPLTKENHTIPMVNAGLMFRNEFLQIGLSANNLTGGSYELGTNNGTIIETVPNYFLSFGALFEVGRTISLHPSLLLKAESAALQAELGTLVQYNDNIYGGVAFRGYNSTSIDAVIISVGLKLNDKMTVGYAYDAGLSDINSVSGGSHELLVNYNLGKPIGAGVPPPIIFNPRF